MTIVQALFYCIGIVAALFMAGRLYTVKTRMAAAFGFLLVGWALNCGMFLVLLLNLAITGEARPAWADLLLLSNSFVLALAPTIVYLFFPGESNHHA